VKLAIFPGDNDTFSITVGAPVDEPRLRGLAEPGRFERFLRAFPAIAPWRAERTSVPIAGPDTPVLVMGELRNRLRRFVDRSGRPLAAGFFAIGDAAYHSNPVYGRGARPAWYRRPSSTRRSAATRATSTRRRGTSTVGASRSCVPSGGRGGR